MNEPEEMDALGGDEAYEGDKSYEFPDDPC